MELRTFIKAALIDITGAVADAQGETEPGTIVPGGVDNSFKSVELGIGKLQAIDFEICVSAEELKGKEGKLGVINSIVGAGISGKSSNESSQSNTLKFRVPIMFKTSGRITSKK